MCFVDGEKELVKPLKRPRISLVTLGNTVSLFFLLLWFIIFWVKSDFFFFLMALYWQVRTGPSFADAAMGRIAQTSKVIAEGGYEKIFKSTFETSPDEILKKTFACYLSTSAGPVMGVLYLSTAKLGFCSDNPLSYKNGDNETTAYSYYKVSWLSYI